MLLSSLIELFERNLLQLENEINSYPEENDLWKVNNQIANSAGNLCLHLVGNLNHFIGAALGNTQYVRNRDLEFSTTNVAREELLSAVRQTSEMVKATLTRLPENELEQEFPLEMMGRKVSTSFLLVYLLAHLNYHLGQINYHRRLIVQ